MSPKPVQNGPDPKGEKYRGWLCNTCLHGREVPEELGNCLTSTGPSLLWVAGPPPAVWVLHPSAQSLGVLTSRATRIQNLCCH